MIATTAGRALALGAVLWLGGCASLSKHDAKAELAWEARRARLVMLDQFSMQARVAAGGVFGMKAQLHWRQRANDFDARVNGPFGAGAIALSGTLQRVEVRTARGTTITEYPDRYLHNQLGWPFPITHLRYWALGLPAPYSDADLELDATGRIIGMTQDGWELRYAEYHPASGLELPRKFEMANDEVRIKVVVDRWTDLALAPGR